MAGYSAHLPLSHVAWNIALFGTGALVMRGAGCTINDLWDRDIDSLVDRTRARPLASGATTPFKALCFLCAQLSVGLAILTQLNLYSILLGASSLAIVIIYPLMKRITYWPQAVLGLAFNWGALLGSSAMLGFCEWQVALPLYVGSIAWTIFYDTIYAHQDKVDDVQAGVKSTALLFGDQHGQKILACFATVVPAMLALSGYMNDQTATFYAISCGGAAAHLAWQLKGLDTSNRANCWQRFISNRDLGLIHGVTRHNR
ncbi:uncharacterized protein L969DRAFT_93537 [Mixia osmundae IAM 14324]|uniref:Uncharacterized protein n=1 Tax=Mixia osmundae (strain CBS 9802 / IAM 14324 / JCM 22182 / KY 12970) TaxID=764103 RepID=G7DU95_MIXOS|nr:uncharacterized protein L969DRAFT_93537 [Mixia osmundae IAM 14324]KEI41026.1 hypothetical protein L969DRAFT_93537 [Mixia osmundae IAM 14324]GAA94155.1 hypothetical protein E5Q_00803 [Mixia osmundae IAM 14324]